MRSSGYAPGNVADLKVRVSFVAVRRLFHLARPYAKWLALAGVLTLLSTAAALALPAVGRIAVNQVVRTRSLHDLNVDAAILACIVGLQGILTYGQYVLAGYAGNKIVVDLRRRLFAHLQRLPVAFFDAHRSGDLTSLLSNDVSQLQTTLAEDLVRLLGNLIMMCGGIGIALWMNWQLTLAIVGLLVVTMAYFVGFGRALRRLNRSALDELSKSMGGMTEALSNIRLVKAFAREEFEDWRADKCLDTVLRIQFRGTRWEGAMAAVATGGFSMMALALAWFGGRSLMMGTMQLGDLTGFVLAVFVMSGPMAQIASLYTRLQRAVGASDRIFEILDREPEQADPPDAVPFPGEACEVKFDSVCFSYVDGIEVLKSLNLTLDAGKVTALVGPSGSGKSTIASLLFRMYRPQSGVISIDGTDIEKVRRKAIREQIGIVPQDPILFSGTLRENILYGRLDASESDLLSAAKEANVDEFVPSLPFGYDTQVGERGVTLSGGQRQRVAIARAMLKNPKILVLDEATSSLDTRSESLVREALERLMVGRTTLVIAHRLSTIQRADLIAVLSEGRIVETGRHQELLKKGGLYAQLHELVGAVKD